MTMDDIVVTTYTNPRGDEYEAIQLPWETVADILGHEHTGNPEDDTTNRLGPTQQGGVGS